jgi:tRNA (mo5U34)-methyltransferase
VVGLTPPTWGLAGRPTVEDVLALDHDWYHTISLGDGAATPGLVDLRPWVHLAGFPDDLTGLRALDVGSYDGFWAFDLERRGAEVVAIDADRSPWPDVARIHLPAVPVRETLGDGFRILRDFFGSEVDRRVQPVSELTVGAIGGPVHLVFVGAVLLHLRDPVGALERIHDVLLPGGHLRVMEPVDAPLSEGPHAATPAARFRVGDSVHSWWYPNETCLRGWVEAAGFVGVQLGGRAWITDTRGDAQLTRTIHATRA